MNEILDIITQAVKREGKTKPYDTTAKVTRIDGNTAWVHIDGGVDETPARKTINAKPGDTVQVRLGGGTAFLVGNATAPPTDDTAALRAKIAADNAEKSAGEAQITADNAYKIADNTNQYFWFKGEDPDETGAHITEIPQEQWDDPNSLYYHTGGNLLARSNGIAVRQGLTELATFGASGAQVGVSTNGHTTIQAKGMKVYGSDGTVELANIGYDRGNAQSGQADAPYYTFGRRKANTDIGNYSIAGGYNSEASGHCAISIGNETVADHNWSVAMGEYASSLGQHAYSFGESLTAYGGQFVIGRFNQPTADDFSYKFIIGNGMPSHPFNVFAVKSNGDVELSGSVVSETKGTMVGSGNISSSGNNHTYSINANATKNQSFTIQRAGYYPLCIDRINLGGTGSDKICLNKYGITARANGSVTYEVAYYNPTSTNYGSITVAVYVLWVKL